MPPRFQRAAIPALVRKRARTPQSPVSGTAVSLPRLARSARSAQPAWLAAAEHLAALPAQLPPAHLHQLHFSVDCVVCASARALCAACLGPSGRLRLRCRYHFKVRNMGSPGALAALSIINFSKARSLYKDGMTPLARDADTSPRSLTSQRVHLLA